MFPADICRQTPRFKRVKVAPDIKVEPDPEIQDVKAEQTPAAFGPPSPEISCPASSEASRSPSPESSCPPSPAASCSSPPEAACPPSHELSCSSPPHACCPSSPEASHASSSEPPEIEAEEAEDEHTQEASCPSSPESYCSSPPELPETTTDVTPQPKCRFCQEPAVLNFTSDLNELNAGRPYFVCPLCPWGYQWVCWADERGVSTVNPCCECKGEVPSRLDVIGKVGKFGRGFWTCEKGKCDYYSENLDGEPGVSFDGGFYPRFRGGKRKHCD